MSKNHDALEQAYAHVLETQAIMQQGQAVMQQNLAIMQFAITEMKAKMDQMDHNFAIIIALLEKLPDEVKRKIGSGSKKS